VTVLDRRTTSAREDGASGRRGGGASCGSVVTWVAASKLRAGASVIASTGWVNPGACGDTLICVVLWHARICVLPDASGL